MPALTRVPPVCSLVMSKVSVLAAFLSRTPGPLMTLLTMTGLLRLKFTAPPASVTGPARIAVPEPFCTSEPFWSVSILLKGTVCAKKFRIAPAATL